MSFRYLIVVSNKKISFEERRDKAISIFIFISLLISIFAEYNYDFFEVYFYSGIGFYACALINMALLITVVFIHKGKISTDNVLYLAYLVLVASYFCLVAFLRGGGYRYVGVVFVSMGFTLIVKQTTINKKMFTGLFFICIIAFVLYASVSKGYFDRQFEIGYDLTNSNYIGLLVVFMIVLTDICLEINKSEFPTRYDKKRIAFIRLFIIATSIYIDLGCKSRAAMISIAFYLLCRYIIPHRLLESKKMILLILITIMVGTIAIPFIYVKSSDLLSIQFLNRSAVTRYRAWNYVTTHLGENTGILLFGHGTRSQLRDILGYPAHNTFLQTWYDTGLFGLFFVEVFTLICVGRTLHKSYKLSKVQSIALIGLMSMIINDTFGVVFTEVLSIWEYTLLGIFMKGNNRR